jgi:chromosome segregation ATPase
MNELLATAEKKASNIRAEKESFVQRHNEATARLEEKRETLSAALEELREAKIDAVLNAEAKQTISKKQKAVTSLMDEVADLEIEIEAVRRKIVELERRVGEAEAELRRKKIDLLLERCPGLREQYSAAADSFAEASKRLSVCVGALQGLNARADLKGRFPELFSFPVPMSSAGSSQSAHILQVSLATNGELRRLFPFVIGKDEQKEILEKLLD